MVETVAIIGVPLEEGIGYKIFEDDVWILLELKLKFHYLIYCIIKILKSWPLFFYKLKLSFLCLWNGVWFANCEEEKKRKQSSIIV